MVRRYQLADSGHHSPSKSGIDYAGELNGQQLQAVMAGPGASLVIAGAGSGKTRTLTYRVAWLTDRGVRPENILLLTFTNKAAKEMIERVRELVPVSLDNLWGGTFHSIANRILRRHADMIGYTSSFSIMDSDDSKTLLKNIIKSAGLGDKERRFPKAEILMAIQSLAVNTGSNTRAVIEDVYPYLLKHMDGIADVLQQYAERKFKANAMDFDDLLTKVVELFEKEEYIRDLYSKRFEYILVDEYQDTNELQSRLVDMLAIAHGNIMVVGDDAQSIYSWRGADMDHILNFTIKYPGAVTYKIETNYRSVPEILALSNAAIAANTVQIPKELHSSRSSGDMSPALVPLPDGRTQALFVGQRIEELVDQGVNENEIAVLYRAHYQSMELQMELTRRKIPYRITSGIRFFEQAHVKDVLAFLRFFANPRDEISFRRIVLMLQGVGPIAADKLWKQWNDILDGMPVEEIVPYVSYKDLTQLRVPKKALEGWHGVCDIFALFFPNPHPVPGMNMIRFVLEGFYSEYMETEFDNCEQRQQDLITMANYAERFHSLDEFLAQMALLSNTDEEQKEDGSGGKITLSTIHQAKGLEWRVVFLIGLCEGMFPHQRVLEDDSNEGLEEERRLFYVAITRAKDQLYLTYPRFNSRGFGPDFNMSPSRFLEDFPSELVEEWQVG